MLYQQCLAKELVLRSKAENIEMVKMIVAMIAVCYLSIGCVQSQGI